MPWKSEEPNGNVTEWKSRVSNGCDMLRIGGEERRNDLQRNGEVARGDVSIRMVMQRNSTDQPRLEWNGKGVALLRKD